MSLIHVEILTGSNPALFDAKNAEEKIPLDYLTFEEGFQFKVLSQRHDIVIVYAIDGSIE